eukprot:TRINITY_DN21578_c0_g1_i2.p1 TRINITY_DN21578_c0_g1~~TRINITY_DN21578_c0_g1_i2.p1  ORF type:complete len:291 (-),score=53.07 TRINITY_DN21578_c0_g1_i2:105-977(-)
MNYVESVVAHLSTASKTLSSLRAIAMGTTVASVGFVTMFRLRANTKTNKLILFSSPRSNFAGRVRYVVYHHALEDAIQINEPGSSEGSVGGGATSLPAEEVSADDCYMQRVREHNRIGKIPLLLLEDGRALPESQIIVEYLDQRFGVKSPLVPTDPAARAQAQLVARIHDVYMGSHFLPTLFRELSAEQTQIGLKWIENALDTLEGLHPGGETFFVNDRVSVADIGLAPTVVYMLVSGEKLRGGSPFHDRPCLKQWWACMMKDSVWLRVYKEMEKVFPENCEAHMFSGRV